MPSLLLASRIAALLFLLPLAVSHAVARFDTAEIVLRSQRAYNGASGSPNPFTDVTLTAHVTSPGGRKFTVDGFFDGNGGRGGVSGQRGNVFKFRVYADERGTWRWRTRSNNPSLNGKTGTFQCAGRLPGVFGKGAIIKNRAHPHSFKYQIGEPVYLIGKFLDVAAPRPIQYSHTLFSESLTEADREAMLDRHAGMRLNKMSVYLANRGDYGGKVPTTPWLGTAANNDKQRFDLARWRLFERWVLRMRGAGIAAHLWFFADDSGFGDLPDADRKRLIRYAMARLSGYSNTMFTVALEWQEGWSPDEVHSTASYVHQVNPWRRLSSVHGTTGNFAFHDAPWADYIQIQSGNGATHPRVHEMGLANRRADKPLINEEFGLGAETTENRRKAWAAFMAGSGGLGTGAFLQHLSRFASLVDFERMSPSDSLVRSGRAYGLAEADRAYVFYLYDGGAVTVDLAGANGTFAAEWYDPRTGAFQGAPAASGGGQRTFTAPAGGDWILYLHR
jgi:hypothetical protein